MGCSDSKSAGSEPSGQPKEKPAENSNNKGSKNSDDYVSADEATSILINELQISPVKAEKVVKKLDRDGDKMVLKSELQSLRDNVNSTKKDIAPLFAKCDPDGDGHVPLEEAAKILAEQFPLMPPEALNRIARRFDSSNDGNFQYGEFVFFYSHCKSKQNKLKDLFDKLDTDGSGTLDKKEATDVLVNECDVEASEAEALIEEADRDQNGTLDKHEFQILWAKLFGADEKE